MSDEEKKAIEKIKSFNQYNWEMNNLKEKEFAKPYFDALDTILNLIEKQSKEIEELKEKNENLLDALNNSIDIRKYWISKDKIKAKIEEEKECGSVDGTNEMIIGVLQSLLEKE